MFSCLYPDRSAFHIVPRVLGCTCSVQDLSPGLDKLSIGGLSNVFLLDIRGLEKDISVTILLLGSIVYVDVTFLEFVSYFSSNSLGILSALVPLPPHVSLSSPKPILDTTAPRSQSECTKQHAPNHFKCSLDDQRFLPLHLPWTTPL